MCSTIVLLLKGNSGNLEETYNDKHHNSDKTASCCRIGVKNKISSEAELFAFKRVRNAYEEKRRTIRTFAGFHLYFAYRAVFVI